MTHARLKSTIHKLVDKTDSKELLEDLKDILSQPKVSKDWWDELSDEDKMILEERSKKIKKYGGKTHAEVVKMSRKWISK